MPTKFKLQGNTSNSGVEVVFEDKPSDAARTVLKGNGFRWSKRNKVWYRKYAGMTHDTLVGMTKMILADPSLDCVEGDFENQKQQPGLSLKAETADRIRKEFHRAKPWIPPTMGIGDFLDVVISTGVVQLHEGGWEARRELPAE